MLMVKRGHRQKVRDCYKISLGVLCETKLTNSTVLDNVYMETSKTSQKI